MKLSELIQQLQAVLAEKGDLTVHSWPYDGQGGLYAPKLDVGELRTGETVLFVDGE